MGGAAVRIGGAHLPILYADARQINVQLPFSFSGAGVLEVLTPNGVVRTGIQVAPVAPSIFVAQDGTSLAVAQHADGTLVSTTFPARAGEIITVMAAGLGAVQGSPELGVPPAAALPVIIAVQVSVGGAAARVIGAHLSTKVPGLYEILLEIPSGPAASAPIMAIAAGIQSNTAVLPVA